jgi:hypothetical protein
MKMNKNGNANQMRQGDVFCAATNDPIPADAKPVKRDNGRLILAYGEVTGHAHAIEAPEVEMYEDSSGTLWLRVPETATLVHEEHSAHTLKPGVYRSTVQQSWSAGFMRRVAD